MGATALSFQFDSTVAFSGWWTEFRLTVICLFLRIEYSKQQYLYKAFILLIPLFQSSKLANIYFEVVCCIVISPVNGEASHTSQPFLLNSD